jgi:hypothetical protein
MSRMRAARHALQSEQEREASCLVDRKLESPSAAHQGSISGVQTATMQAAHLPSSSVFPHQTTVAESKPEQPIQLDITDERAAHMDTSPYRPVVAASPATGAAEPQKVAEADASESSILGNPEFIPETYLGISESQDPIFNLELARGNWAEMHVGHHSETIADIDKGMGSDDDDHIVATCQLPHAQAQLQPVDVEPFNGCTSSPRDALSPDQCSATRYGFQHLFCLASFGLNVLRLF